MAPSPTPSVKDSLLKLESQICFPVYAVSRLITKAYQPLLQALDLTYPQYLVFLLLWEHEQLTVKELGEKLLLDSGTLTPLLKRMEQKQWLSRRRDPRDERSVIIALQPAGRALEAQAQQIPMQMLDKMQLSEAEILSLRTHLTHLLTQLA
ncbi:MarR family winged helix-turn-helix transcriptional regulator [Hymenobacter negativus]|uniref:MarR family transcriptional regulator n=1 Tax=Hymenobacter negativus TaxID=2795026 RepID=A0ABS0QBA7_9BACT|nr:MULTISPECIES: MarR family transcriptional regulator [Bacteria]MBH8559496.1 MarR family transcriptional regulator [Hymenobacter negativus]MBH8568428.1 MarR family transcriptional regulator [Hymenobacter negativus]MBR7208163.1 MarR family transcriptional regulator [Microvirga sp. STS02]